MVSAGQRFFLKRRLFPVSFRASFREVRASGEGCVLSWEAAEVGQADPKRGTSPEMVPSRQWPPGR